MSSCLVATVASGGFTPQTLLPFSLQSRPFRKLTFFFFLQVLQGTASETVLENKSTEQSVQRFIMTCHPHAEHCCVVALRPLAVQKTLKRLPSGRAPFCGNTHTPSPSSRCDHRRFPRQPLIYNFLTSRPAEFSMDCRRWSLALAVWLSVP